MARLALLLALLLTTVARGQEPTAESLARQLDETRRSLAAREAEALRLRLLLDTAGYQRRLDLARREWFDGNLGRSRVLLDECPESLRAFEWRFLDQLVRGGRITGIGANDSGLGLAFRPGDDEVLLLSASGTVFAWDVGPGQEKRFAVPARTTAGPVTQPRRAARSLDGNIAAIADNTPEVRLVRLNDRSVTTITVPAAPVTDLAFSRDGRRLAVLSRNLLSVRDLTNNEDVFSATLMKRGAVCLDLGPAGDTVAVGFIDGTVQVWDLETGRCPLEFQAPGQPTRMRFHPEGDRLAVLVGDRLLLWNLNGPTAQRSDLAGNPANVSSLAWSPDGTRLAAGSANMVLVWDASGRTLLETHRGHTERVRQLAFSTDGRRLASISEDGILQVWDVPGHPAGVLFPAHNGAINAVAWSPDGKRFATASVDRTAKVWDLATRRVLRMTGTHPGPVTCLAYSPDGKELATGCEDGVVRTWDMATGAPLDNLAGFKARITSVAYSPDGKYMAAASQEGLVQERTRDRAETRSFRLPGAGLFGLAFSPDGKQLAVSCSDLSSIAVRILDPIAMLEREQLKGPRAQPALAFSPDGSSIAFASSTGTRILRRTPPASEVALRDLDGSFDQAASLAFSPDGKRLATTGRDRPVRIWDAATGQELIAAPDGISGAALAFSPDGTRLLLGESGGLVRIFEAPERTRPTSYPDASYHLAFSPDGRTMVTGLRQPEHLLQVWDRKTGQRGAILDTLGGGLLSHHVYFSPDGATVRTLQEQRAEGTSRFYIRFWDAARGSETRRIEINPTAPVVHWHWIGTHLAVICKTPEAETTEVRIWDALTGKLTQTIPNVGSRIAGLTLSPDGTRVVVMATGPKGTITTIREAASGRVVVPQLEPPGDVTLSRLVYRPGNGSYVAAHAIVRDAGKSVAQLFVWDSTTGEMIRQMDLHRIGGPMTFTPDGLSVALLDAGVLSLLPLGAGEATTYPAAPFATFQGAQLLFTPDGKQLAIQGGLHNSSRVYLWDYPLPEVGNRADARITEALAAHISHRHSASLALRDRHWYAAVFHLDRLILQQPELHDLYRQRGRALVGLEEYERAVQDFVRAIEGEVNGVGNGLRAEDWKALQPEVERALVKSAKSAALLALLGHSHAGQGQWADAVTAFADSVTADGKRAIVLERYALAALGAGDEALYRKVVAQMLAAIPEPKDATTANNLAWAALLGSAGKPDRPMELAKRAVEAAAFAPVEVRHAYLNTLALAHFRSGKPDEAERMVQAAIEARDGKPTRLDHLLLAIIRASSGKKDAARIDLDQALRGADDDPALKGVWEARVEVARLRAEAERLLK